MIKRVEGYPFSSIPMYSNRMTDSHIGHFDKKTLHILEGYRKAGMEYLSTGQPWFLMVHTGRILDVEIYAHERWKSMGQAFVYGHINNRLWLQRMTVALSEDLSSGQNHAPHLRFAHCQRMFVALCAQRDSLLGVSNAYRLMWKGDDGPVELVRYPIHLPVP
jgi:hypothetical protein